MRIYKYGGAISDNLLIVNSADIKAIDFFNSIDGSALDMEGKRLLDKLIAKIYSENIQDNVTMADDRLIYAGNRLMVRFPEAKSYYGLHEWYVAYEFLRSFYDTGIPNIDKLIRFCNLYIGFNYAEKTAMSGSELSELVSIGDEIRADSYDYSNLIPSFVIEAMKGKIDLSEGQTNKVKDIQADAIFNSLFEELGI